MLNGYKIMQNFKVYKFFKSQQIFKMVAPMSALLNPSTNNNCYFLTNLVKRVIFLPFVKLFIVK